MTDTPIRFIATYLERTTSASWLVRPAMLRTKNAATAPKMICAVSMNLLRRAVIAGISLGSAGFVISPLPHNHS
jgi:hypothetical protein